ncbi:hypothetical protein BV22DRAFT_1051363 [Leucogyrophana mollusca]|uniref:Uncharacterized protein n=1 Tax=Leucogyrophana mollusca TaxID=85980 RepID=A0ACB8B009_9AGAM|nr:hypothetical protein BV22DRAFT_1051363 [Leucogyrophana mollusca]
MRVYHSQRRKAASSNPYPPPTSSARTPTSSARAPPPSPPSPTSSIDSLLTSDKEPSAFTRSRSRAAAISTAVIPAIDLEQCHQLRRQLKEAQKEIEKLHAQQKASDQVANKIKQEARFSMISLRDEALRCGICHFVCMRPFTTTCGHSFCYMCLRDWFQRTIANQLSRRRGVPARLRSPPYTDEDLQYMYRWSYILVPMYNCPTCRGRVKEKPSQCTALKMLMNGVKETFGEVEPSEAGIPHSCPDADLWRGVFTPRKRSFSSIIELTDTEVEAENQLDAGATGGDDDDDL